MEAQQPVAEGTCAAVRTRSGACEIDVALTAAAVSGASSPSPCRSQAIEDTSWWPGLRWTGGERPLEGYCQSTAVAPGVTRYTSRPTTELMMEAPRHDARLSTRSLMPWLLCANPWT